MSQRNVPWWQQRLVAFDLETTDKLPDVARIVAGTIVSVGGGKPQDGVSLLADPGVEIPEEAVSVHGITTERARAEGQPLGEVVGELLFELSERCKDGAVLVVFNARYDLTVLDRMARMFDMRGLLAAVKAMVFDPLVVDRHLDPYRSPEIAKHDLAGVCRVYGVRELQGAHDATADAIAAARCAYAIGKRGRIIRKTDYPDRRREALRLRDEWNEAKDDIRKLVPLQRRWACEQGMDFAKYLRDHEATSDDVLRTQLREGCFWPTIPVDWDPLGRRILAEREGRLMIA